MKKILIVLSSVREIRAADSILGAVQTQLAEYPDYEMTVVDFKKIPLPFFDSPISPADDAFAPSDPNVINWIKMVEEADALVMLVAEYNHSFTAVLKNAIDWMAKPWNEKPIALVGYGWVGGSRATAQLRSVLVGALSAKAMETEANLRFMKEIDPIGNVIDQDAANASIKTVLEELKTVL